MKRGSDDDALRLPLWLTLAVLAGLFVPARTARALNPNHDCAFCHSLHDAPGTSLLDETDVEVLCLTCHSAAGSSSLKAAKHEGQTCMVCHDPHSNPTNWLGGTNLKLVLDSVFSVRSGTWRPVVFESRGVTAGDPTLHSFCDGDEDGNGVWDAVCDTCHKGMGRHAYDRTNTHGHQQGKTCTRSGCHEHVRGFKPKD